MVTAPVALMLSVGLASVCTPAMVQGRMFESSVFSLVKEEQAMSAQTEILNRSGTLVEETEAHLVGSAVNQVRTGTALAAEEDMRTSMEKKSSVVIRHETEVQARVEHRQMLSLSLPVPKKTVMTLSVPRTTSTCAHFCDENPATVWLVVDTVEQPALSQAKVKRNPPNVNAPMGTLSEESASPTLGAASGKSYVTAEGLFSVDASVCDTLHPDMSSAHTWSTTFARNPGEGRTTMSSVSFTAVYTVVRDDPACTIAGMKIPALNSDSSTTCPYPKAANTSSSAIPPFIIIVATANDWRDVCCHACMLPCCHCCHDCCGRETYTNVFFGQSCQKKNELQ